MVKNIHKISLMERILTIKMVLTCIFELLYEYTLLVEVSVDCRTFSLN